MDRNNGSADAANRDGCGRDECESLDLEPAGVGPSEPEDGVIGAGDEDLDELDAPIDPDFSDGEAWDVDGLDLVEDEEEDEDEDDEAFDDEAEMHLLHELGIDLDAPESGTGLDLSLHLERDDPADDGVAA